ncbi:MAG: FAD-dependent monooxygenase [Bacteroidetes bacterium]|nr:FAD-dependent monooxygenase [Bacteroidota bacterium]
MKTSVLIIGAGPTGLMMACLLRRMGIDCLIADTKQGPTEESRALVVQARSLEIYRQMGLSDAAWNEGAAVRSVRVLGTKGLISTLPFQQLGGGQSRFSEALIFEQSKNETLLYEDLKNQGGEVMWQHELVELTQQSDACFVRLKAPDGSALDVEAGWVLGADGARSFVRHSLQLGFSGGTYEHIFYVADTGIQDSKDWSHDSVNIYFSRTTFLGLLPMPGTQRFRAIGELPSDYQNEAPEQFEEIAHRIESSLKLPLHFQNTRWFSVYRLHHRHTDHFRIGRVFLAGDAAHIHSPVGGQGMNTGLQDAYNLAWKLAFVVRGLLHEKVLNSYEQERMPVAKRLLQSTDKAFMMVNSTKAFPVFLRTWLIPRIIPFLMRFRKSGRWIFKNIAQIGIRYPESMLSIKPAFASLKTGMRLPYVLLNDGSSIHDLLKAFKFHLLIFASNEATENIRLACTSFADDLLELVVISDGKTARKLGITRPAAILIRPDMHIVSAVPIERTNGLLQFLKSIQA